MTRSRCEVEILFFEIVILLFSSFWYFSIFLSIFLRRCTEIYYSILYYLLHYVNYFSILNSQLPCIVKIK